MVGSKIYLKHIKHIGVQFQKWLKLHNLRKPCNISHYNKNLPKYVLLKSTATH